jgi:hypothetical protein
MERFGRKQSWPNFKVLSRHSPGRTEEKPQKSQSMYLVFGPRFELGLPKYVAGVLTIQP